MEKANDPGNSERELECALRCGRYQCTSGSDALTWLAILARTTHNLAPQKSLSLNLVKQGLEATTCCWVRVRESSLVSVISSRSWLLVSQIGAGSNSSTNVPVELLGDDLSHLSF